MLFHSVFESVCCVRSLFSTPCDSYQEAIGKDVDAANFLHISAIVHRTKTTAGKAFTSRILDILTEQIVDTYGWGNRMTFKMYKKTVQRH